MRIDDALRVGMWQMKGDEAHVSLKIGGAYYSLDKERDSEGRYAERPKPYTESESFDSEPTFESETDEDETDDEDEADNEDEADDEQDEQEVAELSEIEKIDERDAADFVLHNNPTEIGKPDVAPGLNEDPTADDDDKPNPLGPENEGGHLTYRPDWVKCHEQENQIIEKIDHPERSAGRTPRPSSKRVSAFLARTTPTGFGNPVEQNRIESADSFSIFVKRSLPGVPTPAEGCGRRQGRSGSALWRPKSIPIPTRFPSRLVP